MKQYKAILPDYPQTKHVPFKPNMSKDDVEASFNEVKIIFTSPCQITEKVDGANCAMALHEGEPIIRNRNHILKKGFHKNTAAKMQFASVFNWFYKNKTLYETLNEIHPNLGVYGEWVLAIHGMKYDKLPDYFIAYDLYDYAEKKYLHTQTARKLLLQAGFEVVPELYYGKVKSFEQLEDFCDLNSDYAKDQNAEGIYLKVDGSDGIIDRFKMIREGFVQSALWNPEKFEKNLLEK